MRELQKACTTKKDSDTSEEIKDPKEELKAQRQKVKQASNYRTLNEDYFKSKE